MLDLAPLVAAVPEPGRPTLIAVDGVDGAGKTTFAARFAGALADRGRPVQVVHLDDFLNPREVRYRSGRSSPEGYFLDTYDLSAFTANVIDPLLGGGTRSIVPRVFDYETDTVVHQEPVAVPEHVVVVIEGMFLHRRGLASLWDMSIFLQVPFTVTAKRMAERDGSHPDPDHPSLARYVEGQRLYLSTCSPAERATHVVDNA